MRTSLDGCILHETESAMLKPICLFLLTLAAGTICLFAAEETTSSVIDAVKNGDKFAFKALLQKKADVNAADPDGSTALHWAAHRDDLEIADALLRAGAKVNATTDLNVTPLWLASQNGSTAMVRRLLAAGANPNLALFSGETPLMVAARSG